MANNSDAATVTLMMIILPMILEAFFFGLYSALFIFSTIVLFRRPPSRMRHAMLTLSVVMYAVSAAHWALSISFDVMALESGQGYSIVLFFLTYLPNINYILSDGIVLWRAWVLWNRRFLLFIPPLISLVCTLGITIASAIYFLEGAQVDTGKGFIPIQALARSFDFFVIGTNFWATGLIFIRAWQHRRFLRSFCIKETFRNKTEKTLAFLVESGGLYLCIWIAHISTSFVMNRDPYAVAFFFAALIQFTGMYPTMIIIVVTMQLSTADILSRSDAEAHSHIVFTPPSSNPAQPQIAGDVQTSLDSMFIGVSSDATSTGVVTLSVP